MHLNTPVAAIMELINVASPIADREGAGAGELWAMREAFEILARVIGPFAPHFAEEVWEALERAPFVANEPWPEPDPALLVDETSTVAVQVNGRLRGQVELPRGASQEEAVAAARTSERVAPHLDGKTVRRVVYVADRLLNLVLE
jgi:leucyl-tRNA synthetase